MNESEVIKLIKDKLSLDFESYESGDVNGDDTTYYTVKLMFDGEVIDSVNLE